MTQPSTPEPKGDAMPGSLEQPWEGPKRVSGTSGVPGELKMSESKVGAVDGDELLFQMKAEQKRCGENRRSIWLDEIIKFVEAGRFSLPSSPSPNESRYREALKEILGSCDGDLCADMNHHEIAREALAATEDQKGLKDGHPG